MSSAPLASGAHKINVMICDDSSVMRGAFSRMLEGDSSIHIRYLAANGQLALRALEATKGEIDVILLDIEMPVMDGLTALPQLLAVDPSVQVIVSSALSEEQGRNTFKAMQLGAKDCIPKPRNMRDPDSLNAFQQQLLTRVRDLATARRKRLNLPLPQDVAAPSPRAVAPLTTLARPVLRPQALAIGSSTGGPQAVLAVLKNLPLDPELPVFITQHMPATFTKIFAEQITKSTPWPCREGGDGMEVRGGHAYLAPGDYHLTVLKTPSGVRVQLNQDPPESFCRPAVDPMLRALATVYGKGLLTIILTGMGSDGEKGIRRVVDAGGVVLAQDEASSVVWGMPGAAARTGLCTAILPLDQIAPYLNRVLRGGAA